MIKVIYNKVCGRCVQSEPLTSGMVGQPIHFEYSHDFDGLAATAVFTDGANTVNVVNPGSECIIPHEVLTTVGAAVKVGIYAVKGDELVIPTVYATIGFVLKGADPNGGISEDPTLPVWAQTQAMIGNLNALETQAKENLVAAVNEVKNTADGKQDIISDLETIRAGAAKGATALQSVPNTYRTAAAQDVIDNGLRDRVSAIEGKEAGWNSKYAKPADGIPKADLANDVQASLDKADTALQEHQSLAAYRTAAEQNIIDNGKQDKLIAGENITIAADGKTISATGGGSSVPKPLTYDYMPEGYPTKAGQATTLMEEQELAFAIEDLGLHYADLTTPFEIVVDQTYTVKWDGTDYECIGVNLDGSVPTIGNPSIMGMGDDTGEPFICGYNMGETLNVFYTLDTSPTHTISVKTTQETIIPMAEEFIPTTAKLPNPNPLTFTGAVTGSYDGSEPLTVEIPSGGGGVQPDWNQNDSTAADYVKNRPFYTGNPVETVLVEESTVSFTNPSANTYYGAIPTTIELIAGETYKVSWDGATYECVCELIMGNTAIGNMSIMGMGADTGVPFLIMPLADNQSTEIYTLDTSNSHTISISAFVAAEVVKISDKYISDTFRDIIIAGDPLTWSADDWTKYYDLFQGGKLLKINSSLSSAFEGYVLAMLYKASPRTRQISVITSTGGFYKLSSNSTTNELYWEPIFKLNMLYFRYQKTGYQDQEEYQRLEVSDGLKFTTKTSAEGPVERKVALEGDNVSAFTNDAGYLTLATLPKYEGVVE